MYSTTTFWSCGVTLFPLWLVALLRIIFCNSFHLVRNSCLLYAHGHAPRRRPPPHAFVLFWIRLTFVGQFPLLPLPLPPLLVRWTRLAFPPFTITITITIAICPRDIQRILVAQVHFCYCFSSWVFFSFCLECRSFLSTHQLLVAAFWLICIFISMSGRWDFLSISAFSATHCVAKDIYVAIFTFFNLLLSWF